MGHALASQTRKKLMNMGLKGQIAIRVRINFHKITENLILWTPILKTQNNKPKLNKLLKA